MTTDKESTREQRAGKQLIRYAIAMDTCELLSMAAS